MSRAAKPAFPRAGGAAGATETDDGVDIDRVHQVRTTAAAAGVYKPPGAVRSVFDQVPRMPAVPRKARRSEPLPDLDSIVIETGVRVPPAKQSGPKHHPAALLLERMLPGQSVLLSELQARTMRTNARKLKVPVAVRNMGNGTARIWRLEPTPQTGAQP